MFKGNWQGPADSRDRYICTWRLDFRHVLSGHEALIVTIVDTVKRRLHRDIVADPLLHGLVLNLYLNGEQYPHMVDDYFPVAVGEEWGLADSMRRHLADEDKHVSLYAKAISKLGQPVLNLPIADIFNEVIRTHTPTSFAMQPEDDCDARRLKLAHFLAHAHFLEKRIARSLDYHVEACAQAASPYPGKAVATVLHDELHHVTYTRQAVHELLPSSKANEVLELHRAAEHRANLDFSQRQMSRLLGEYASRFSFGHRLLFRGCVSLLREFLRYA